MNLSKQVLIETIINGLYPEDIEEMFDLNRDQMTAIYGQWRIPYRGKGADSFFSKVNGIGYGSVSEMFEGEFKGNLEIIAKKLGSDTKTVSKYYDIYVEAVRIKIYGGEDE